MGKIASQSLNSSVPEIVLQLLFQPLQVLNFLDQVDQGVRWHLASLFKVVAEDVSGEVLPVVGKHAAAEQEAL